VGHLELLRRNAGFRMLFLATLGSLLGTWLATIALTVDVYDRTHSGSWVSALLIAVFLPTIVVGVAVGPLLDRLSRRRLMIASDLLRAGVFVALPFVDRPLWIVGLAGLRVGYGIAPADVVTEIGKVRRAFDVSSAAQAAALASLGDE